MPGQRPLVTALSLKQVTPLPSSLLLLLLLRLIKKQTVRWQNSLARTPHTDSTTCSAFFTALRAKCTAAQKFTHRDVIRHDGPMTRLRPDTGAPRSPASDSVPAPSLHASPSGVEEGHWTVRHLCAPDIWNPTLQTRGRDRRASNPD